MKRREPTISDDGPHGERSVEPGECGRLDSYLFRLPLTGLSRRTIQRHLDSGLIAVNGRAARKGQQVVPGDLIRFPLSLLKPNAALRGQPALPVKVLFADDDCLALDKPAGMASVALAADDTGTLANFLVAHFPETATAGSSPLESGLVHRLDQGTSGVVLAARNRDSWEHLRRQFADRRVFKEYWAIVMGDCSESRRIETPIGPVAGHAERMQVAIGRARKRAQPPRPALTEIRPRQRLGAATLLEVVIETGVRHQIRVHLASIGHPVIGDDLYGGGHRVSPARPLLHARRVRFRHPRTGATITVVAPPPPDFRAALARFRKERPAKPAPTTSSRLPPSSLPPARSRPSRPSHRRRDPSRRGDD
jgi:23S rRNA pseudouridine1911/1915/1917 synthase